MIYVCYPCISLSVVTSIKRINSFIIIFTYISLKLFHNIYSFIFHGLVIPRRSTVNIHPYHPRYFQRLNKYSD